MEKRNRLIKVEDHLKINKPNEKGRMEITKYFIDDIDSFFISKKVKTIKDFKEESYKIGKTSYFSSFSDEIKLQKDVGKILFAKAEEVYEKNVVLAKLSDLLSTDKTAVDIIKKSCENLFQHKECNVDYDVKNNDVDLLDQREITQALDF